MSNLPRMIRIPRLRHGILLGGVALLAACSETLVPDFNNPSENNYVALTSRAQAGALIVGLADGDRLSHDFQILVNETIARDVYRLDGAESRYITQPLGASLSPNVFIGGSIFTQPYRTIRSAENLIRATRADATVLEANERRLVIGYAQTMKALQYIRLIEQRDTVGIAIYTTPDDINPLQCKENILEYISAVLDSAAVDLAASGDAELDLPRGFDGFTDGPGLLQFNRALKARNEVFRGFRNFARSSTGVVSGVDASALALAQAALDASFLDPADLDKGVFHTYSTTAGDYVNPNFNQSIYRINPRVVFESEGVSVVVNGAGDTTAVNVADRRIAEKVELGLSDNCRTIRDATSCFLDRVNSSPTKSLPIIRSDELYLLQAEVFYGLGQFAQALAIVNDLRAREGGFTTPLTEASLGGPFLTTPAARTELLRRILREKRNQLLFESASRLVDFRMFGLLDELGNERRNAGDDEEFGTDDDFEGYPAIPVFPIPNAERLARGGDLTKSCN